MFYKGTNPISEESALIQVYAPTSNAEEAEVERCTTSMKTYKTF